MRLTRQHLLVLGGFAGAFMVGWMIVPGQGSGPIGASQREEPTRLTPQQVNREADPVNLAARPGAPGSVPMALRRATSNTCEGYNIELVEAAAIETRQGRHDSAARLLALRQDCAANTPEHYRSSLR